MNNVSNEGREGGGDGVISLLAGIGVGVLIGAAVALILAPQSGQQTRAQIRETADDALGRVRDSIDDLKGKVDEIAANTKEAVASRLNQRPNPAQGDVAGATDEAVAGA